jgi:RNA recognition motif-containing protein
LETFKSKGSRGCGYVQFEREEDAARSITELHGRVIGGKAIQVLKHIKDFKKGADGAATESTKHGPNNLFVKNFPEGTNDEALRAMFSQVAIEREDPNFIPDLGHPEIKPKMVKFVGEVTSAVVKTDE